MKGFEFESHSIRNVKEVKIYREEIGVRGEVLDKKRRKKTVLISGSLSKELYM
jgi:hypothetical protein